MKQAVTATGTITTAPEDGAKGDRGQLPYPSGDYSPSQEYTSTTHVAPFVLYEKTYYVMNRITSWLGTSTGKTPSQDYAANGINATWIPFEKFKAIYVELLFAKFGLLGSAVFYDEFMFSQHGKDNNGNSTSDYSGFASGTFTPNILMDFLSGSGHLAASNITWDAYGNTFFKGSIFNPLKKIQPPASGTTIYLDFTTGFNLDISGLTGYSEQYTALLPDARDYIGAQCTIWYSHVCTRVLHFHPHIGVVNNKRFYNLMDGTSAAYKFTPHEHQMVKLVAVPTINSDYSETVVESPDNVDVVS